MPVFEIIKTEEAPYLYVERNTSMEPEDISAAMGAAFSEVWSFMQDHSVSPTGGALSVYYDYSEIEMTFRAGFTIAREDMDKAEGPVQADVTPAGRVLRFTHKGPYDGLMAAYNDMMEYMQHEGLEPGKPSWEIYLNSPDEVPMEELLTECYVKLM